MAKGVRRIGPSKDVVRLSEELERMLAAEQLAQKAPKGKAKCPLCGVILEPTRNRKVRTHDDPIKGRRCDASGELDPKAPVLAKASQPDKPKGKPARKPKPLQSASRRGSPKARRSPRPSGRGPVRPKS